MPIVEFTNLNKYGNMRTRRFWRESSSLSFNPNGFGPFVNYRLFKYDYEGILPPAILKLGGKTYIVPSWQEVLPETRLEDINWIKPKPKVKKQPIIETNISGSGLGEYKTKYYPESGKFHCSCPGYWRSSGNCKHVKALKLKVGYDKNTK
tara:strand:- start:1126 stop:1575 length:450 start_codon:yes stop_codon:yes gene_type:complete